MLQLEKGIQPSKKVSNEYLVGKEVFDLLKESGDSTVVTTKNPKAILVRLRRLSGDQRVFKYETIKDNQRRFWRI